MVTTELLKRVKDSIKTAADSQYFFDNLGSARWVLPLREAGYFRDPPGSVDKGDSISFPVWPQSRYLARIADQDPQSVIEVIRDIPDIGNPRIYEDLVDASLKLPAELANTLAPRALTWSRTEYQLLMPYRLAELAIYLAENGFRESGLRILRELLTILPDPKADESDSTEPSWFVPRPRPRIDEWNYKEIVANRFEEIVNATGIDGLKLACDLLGAHVRLSSALRLGSEDYSFIWRPAIESHSQNRHQDLVDALIEAVRDGAIQLIRGDPKLASEVIREIESNHWLVFQRISLHLMRMNPEILEREISERLTSKDLITSETTFHEFWMLAGEQFENVPTDIQSALLEHIKAGPTVWSQHTEDDSDNSTNQWKWRRLAMLKSDLPDSWKIEFKQLMDEFGQSEPIEFPYSYSGVMTGPNSPLTKDDLIGMGPVGIVEWIRVWEPSKEFMGPSPEGLSRVLASAVSENPAPFSDSAKVFIGMEPTYVRGLVDGFKQACTDGNTFDWAEVLRLCEWALAQTRGGDEDQSERFESDTTWMPARRSIARLITEGMVSTTCEIPFQLKADVWPLVESLTRDPEPLRADEVEGHGFIRDPATASINMMRGMAMHACVHFALWAKRNSDDDAWAGFADIPEVAEVLEEHLDIDVEATSTVRAVYGQWFPWLVLLDPDWATAKVDVIFPADEEVSYLHSAAWDTYLVMTPAYDNIFALLRNQYLLAIERIEDPAPEGYGYRHPATCLAEHLMAFYWRGKVSFGDEDELLELFFEAASDELRADAIGFVGRAVENSDDPIPEEIMDRLINLWELRSRAIHGSGEVQSHQKELSAFGWWFRASQLDDQWAINSLLDVLPAIKAIECDSHVVQRLAEISPIRPYPSVHALRLMTERDEEGWRMSLWSANARIVLDSALRSGDDTAKQNAIDLINFLVARSDRQFVDLLSTSE